MNPASQLAVGPCPGYRLGLSQDKSASKKKKKDETPLKIDAALYKTEELPKDGRPHWETARLLIEFKRGGGQYDPFDDKKGDGASETRTDVRGQITTYVANAFSCQHRVAMFFLLVNGNQLRVTRWDRSGTVFTESFKYTQQRERLPPAAHTSHQRLLFVKRRVGIFTREGKCESVTPKAQIICQPTFDENENVGFEFGTAKHCSTILH